MQDLAEGQPRLYETPRKRAKYDITQDFQTVLRRRIGEEMNDEIRCCDVDLFQSSYLPQIRLPEEELRKIREAGVTRAQSLFQKGKAIGPESEHTRHLKYVVEAIVKARDERGGQRHLVLSMDQNRTIISAILGGNFKIDASLTKNVHSVHSTDTMAALEVKRVRNIDEVRNNRLQLASDIIHFLNDDIRRMFMFGITLEANFMTLWYFSRSHSMKSRSFNIAENPNILVDVLISLVFADDKELGLDPNIALVSNDKRQYIYTVHGQAGPRRFLTTHSISENRALNAAGRMTRVFRVVELEGQTNSPKDGAKPMILKDVWLDEGAKTELEIQRELFADIQQFADNLEWRKHACLSAFSLEEDVPVMDDFANLLESERYKYLFLIARDGSTGERSKPLARPSWPDKSKVFYPEVDEARAVDEFLSTQRTSTPQTSAARNLRNRPAAELTVHEYRKFAPKQRSFLLFDDECTRLYCLPTVGDVVTILNAVITALRLLFCAGWVHRDISCNNIMAIRDPETQQWRLKLADIEYAKKFNFEQNNGTSDPKTGTPFFMPCEILQRKYFGFEGKRTRAGPDDRELVFAEEESENHPIIHNFLHDIEASFWTGLWIVTCRVNHVPSKDWARLIFQDTPTLHLSTQRLYAFRDSILRDLRECLANEMKDLAKPLEAIRYWLSEAATGLGREEAWSMAKGCRAYSKVHANVSAIFRKLADALAKESPPWATVKLQTPTSTPRPMDIVVDEGSDEQPVASSLVEEKAEEEFARRVSPRNGSKRSHRDVEGPDADGDDESRPSQTKRTKSNGGGRKTNNGGKAGGRTPASGPSGAPTTA